MSKSIFIAGTGTDVGKTYLSALVVKRLRQAGVNAGYYKAAASGVELDEAGKLIGGDPIYVNEFAQIGEAPENLVSYVYKEPLSPHLAARINKRPIEFDVIEQDYRRAFDKYEYLVVEGSGGVICPLRCEESARLFTLDIVRRFKLPIMLIADAGLGTINSTVLTVEYLRRHDYNVNSLVLNRFTDNVMCADNALMIEELTRLPIIATVGESDTELDVDIDKLTSLFS